MRKIYFTCGPSQLYPTVPNHIKNALRENILSISHRSKRFEEIFSSTQKSLRKLMAIPKNFHIFFLSSSLEAMERTIENCVEKQSAHFVNGSFSQKWMETAIAENRKVKLDKKAELICLTQNETSTGESIPLQIIYSIKKTYTKALIALDIVSSAPYIDVDFSKIDLAFFSVQKGFGLPSGMGVLLVNDTAVKISDRLKKKGIFTGGYHSFADLIEKEKINQTPETPNVLAIYLLGKVCREMNKKGIAKIRKETENKARIIYNFFDNHPKYKPEVEKIELRSVTTININVGNDKNKIMQKLASKGLSVSSGYGKFKETHIRIANFPAHSIKSTRKLLNLIGYN